MINKTGERKKFDRCLATKVLSRLLPTHQMPGTAAPSQRVYRLSNSLAWPGFGHYLSTLGWSEAGLRILIKASFCSQLGVGWAFP